MWASWRSATSHPGLTFHCDTSHLISQPPRASHSLMSDTMRTPTPPLFPLSVLPFISSPILSFHPLSSLTDSPPIICVVSVCYRVWIWDDEANVLLAANYINALSSLNCLSLPAQPFPNTGALSCLSRGWLLRAGAGPEVGEGETHVTVEDKETYTEHQLRPTHKQKYSKSPSGNVLNASRKLRFKIFIFRMTEYICWYEAGRVLKYETEFGGLRRKNGKWIAKRTLALGLNCHSVGKMENYLFSNFLTTLNA